MTMQKSQILSTGAFAKAVVLAVLMAASTRLAEGQLVTPPTQDSITPPPSTASFNQVITVGGTWTTNLSNTGSWNTGTQTCFSWFICYVTPPNSVAQNQSVYNPVGSGGVQNTASQSFSITLNQAGTWSIQLVCGDGRPWYTYSATYTVVVSSPITAVTITGPTTFTGGALTPTYTTTPAGGTVTFSPTTETNAGSYTLNWTGSGGSAGSGTASWTIAPASLTAAGIQSVPYTGSALQPSSVTSVTPAGGSISVSSAASHTGVGTYSDGIVTLAAGTNYSASSLSGLSWSITPAPITAATIRSVANNGSAQQPSSVTSVTPSGATVSVSSSASHTAAGTYADGIVTGTGNYSGMLSGQTWTITPQSQAAVSITPASVSAPFGQSPLFTAGGGSGTGAYVFTNNGPVAGSAVNATTDAVTFGAVGVDSVSLYRAADPNFAQSGTVTATVTVTKATPVGSLGSQLISSATALTSQMLSAVFTNPNSPGVTQPTGTVTYSAPGYPSLTVGSTLPLGIYTVTASYPGDSNYNAATASAVFTVMNKLGSSTFGYVGGQSTYTAPANTNYVTVKAWGAGGGEGVGTPGGGGAFVTASAAVSGGQTLSIIAGGAGAGYSSGGWPGGGTAAGLGGAGGGGYTRVWGGPLNLWAGAGGGGGNGSAFGGVGGAGGAPTGGAGGGTGAGGGGTQSSGGAGGSGNTAAGSQGSAGAGGNSNNNSNYVGGGGGSGYFGGGGGGTGTYGNGGGGGGGGSSYVATNTTSSSYMGGSGSTPGGTSDPEYPGSSIGYGGNTGTYTSGYNGYVVIDAFQMPVAPVFSNVPTQSSPQTFGNLQVVSYQVQATGTPAVTSYAVATGSSLPPGYSLNTSTGLVTGSCSAAPTNNASYSTTITATNSVGTTTATYYWTIVAPILQYTSAGFSNPTPLAGATITFTYTVTSNFGVYWTEGELWPPSGPPTNLQNTYPSGPPFPTTFSGTKTITVGTSPGIYTYQLRIVDTYQNYYDYWFIFQVGEETDPLPYSTSFETSGSPAWALGQVNVENGWMAWQGGAYVVASSGGYPVDAGSDSLQLLGSAQYALLDGGIPITLQLVKAFNTTGGSYTGAYIDQYAMPAATASVLNSSIINNTDSEIGFQTISSSQATVMVLNGNGTGGGTWTDTGIHFAIDSTGKSTSWLRISAFHNYSSHKWSLWVNGAFFGSGTGSLTPQTFGMVSNTATSVTAVTWFGSTNTSYMDNLNVGTTNPFPTPAAPAITAATGAGNSITISWNPPSPPDPYGINVYQVEYAAGSGGYTTYGTTTGTSMTIGGLTVGTTYSFKVQAENLSGNWSVWSAALTTTLESIQLASNPTLAFTYNGAVQGPPLNSSTFTVSPSGATYSVSGTTVATNAQSGPYSFTLTPSGGFVGSSLTVSWTLNPMTPTISLSPTSGSVLVGQSVGFTVSGGGGNGFTWTVLPNGSTGLSGSGGAQTVTFPVVALSGGTRPTPVPYVVSVFSNANPPNFLQSATSTATVTVTAQSSTDTSNTTVQLNVHSPTQ